MASSIIGIKRRRERGIFGKAHKQAKVEPTRTFSKWEN